MKSKLITMLFFDDYELVVCLYDSKVLKAGYTTNQGLVELYSEELLPELSLADNIREFIDMVEECEHENNEEYKAIQETEQSLMGEI